MVSARSYEYSAEQVADTASAFGEDLDALDDELAVLKSSPERLDMQAIENLERVSAALRERLADLRIHVGRSASEANEASES